MDTTTEPAPRTIVGDPALGLAVPTARAVARDANPARFIAAASATTGVPTGGANPARITLPIADLRWSGAPA